MSVTIINLMSIVFQLLNSLHIVAEYSLQSLLKTLFKWYEKQVRKTAIKWLTISIIKQMWGHYEVVELIT